jgi:ATP-dependent Lhr-like helicase
LASLNCSELAQRRFREIARIAGLVLTGYPGAPRSQRQWQASARLFYEVFAKHDSDNLLLRQAHTEALQHELDLPRLQRALERMQEQTLHFQQISRPTPLAFPLMIERLRERLSTEKLSDRVQRLLS